MGVLKTDHRMTKSTSSAFAKPFILVLVFLGFLIPLQASPSFVDRALHYLQGGGSETAPLPQTAEVAFSPGGGATELIIKTIGAAKQSIRIAAYSFTSRPIAKALIEAHQAGIDVKVVVDRSQIEISSHSVVPILALANIPVRVDTEHALQHDKYMIIDAKTVETGSFNYTAAAEQRNSENVLVLWETPELARLYGDNWQLLWDSAEPYAAPRVSE